MKRILNKKSVAVLVSVALLLCLTVGGTLALLIDETGALKNIFNPSKVTTSVDETFDGQTKTNVSIKNTGDINAMIRASIVVTWKNAEGHVYGAFPVMGTDYNMTINTNMQENPAGQWTLSNGIYYWSAPVAPNANTGILITTCSPIAGRAPEGYFLNVDIVASGIQAEGITGTHPWGI